MRGIREAQFAISFFNCLVFLCACNQPKSVFKKPHISIDTASAIKISNYWVVPKAESKFIPSIAFDGDTLTFTSCSDYAFYPFGVIENKSHIKTGLLKAFNIKSRIDTMDNGAFEFQFLTLLNSRLILQIDDDEMGERSSYIFKGDITDSEVELTKGVRIGMKKREFVDVFFDYFPPEQLSNYDVIGFETCLEDVRHTYVFEKDLLKSINFKSHGFWKVEYQ